DSSSDSSGQAQQEKSSVNPPNTNKGEETNPQTEGQPELAQNQSEQNRAQPKADEKDQAESKSEHSTSAEQSSAQSEQQKQSRVSQADKKTDEQNASEKTEALTPTTDQNLDPILRKLEQVESARDPSTLLRAQFILQAKSKPQPTETDQPW
ncbi:hypothetical protein NTH31_002803, partial [Vibrio mimicus]